MVPEKIAFPRIVVCSKSMHSQEKLKHYYPQVSWMALEHLYGRDVPKVLEKRNWRILNSLNLTDFFEKTRPTYYIVQCYLSDNIDCRKMWNLIWTFRGACLGQAKLDEKISALKIYPPGKKSSPMGPVCRR